jgi:hypothetical protein
MLSRCVGGEDDTDEMPIILGDSTTPSPPAKSRNTVLPTRGERTDATPPSRGGKKILRWSGFRIRDNIIIPVSTRERVETTPVGPKIITPSSE